MPLPYTRDRYLKFSEMDADVVIGHHHHVSENYELFDNGKAIFCSLGNFIFDTNYQRVHLYTGVGVLLKLNFTEEKMDIDAVGKDRANTYFAESGWTNTHLGGKLFKPKPILPDGKEDWNYTATPDNNITTKILGKVSRAVYDELVKL